MLEKLKAIEVRYDELSQQLSEPKIISDPERLQRVARAHSELGEIVESYHAYLKTLKDLENTRNLLVGEKDSEMAEMAREEVTQLEGDLERCAENIRTLLLPKDPNDERNVILEIRAGTGGDEATLFAQDIFRMYMRYAETKKWKTEIVSSNHSSVGGLKEIVATISGDHVYSRMRWESGVQRVQRVPDTETQGRIHTSALTVAVLPEVDEVEIKISPEEIRIDTYCSSGPGGQSVNTTYSAVRITHLPTGEVVTCQDEKSQIKNKAKALKVLRSRLFERALREQQSEVAENRKSMVGSGDRSEKIRTYNFPQNRVTDHRIGLTLHRLDSILEGAALDEIIEALIGHYQTEALREIKA
ncbi:MAG: peptide chain release factor 1 [Acidobacteriota bacterium]